ncbi:MAG: DeoR family transcriptional regulator [Kiloniellaceae bacterium]|nr:DeoR family transcriptional regulator [Kiloniellaceae bacterium]
MTAAEKSGQQPEAKPELKPVKGNGRLDRDERHRRIIAELKSNPTVRISHLAEAFKVSTETVRRDIDDLSSRGLVARTYGGAAAPMGREPSIGERTAAMVSERQRIAAVAIQAIAPGDVVMIDSGATTHHLAEKIAALRIEATVITNGLDIAEAVGVSDRVKVILCPGAYSAHEKGVYGQDTCEYLERFHANVAFTSAGGLTEGGITDVDSQACWIKRTMFRRAERRIFMADHTKFNIRLLEIVMPLAALTDLVTDKPLPKALAEAAEDAEVTAVVA